VKFILYKNFLEEVVSEGYKSFKVIRKKEYSVDFADKERDISINTGSERSFGLGGKGFCVNTSYYSYPYMPSTPDFFETQVEALSFAVILMEGVIRYNTRYFDDSQLTEIVLDFLKEDKGTLIDNSPLSIDLLIAKLLNKNHDEWLNNYMKVENLKFKF